MPATTLPDTLGENTARAHLGTGDLVIAGHGVDRIMRNALLRAYPGAFVFEGDEIVFRSGTRLPWDGGAAPSIRDMFEQVYPLAAEGPLIPPVGFDPGRVRNESFFKALYGANWSQVAWSTKRVRWGAATIRVTRKFRIADRLGQLWKEVPPELARYFERPGGGFAWRTIAGSTALSFHSFGAAVDINVSMSDYWQWGAKNTPISYKNRIPLEVAALFEKHGFIWGGRWHHYDTMHFEYRPELLAYARALRQE